MSVPSSASLRLDPPVIELLARLAAIVASDNLDAYLVGGCLRDALLDRPVADIDLAVDGDPEPAARRLAREADGHFVALDPQRGLMRVILDSGAVHCVDMGRLRGDLSADLGERDFTIDALAAPLAPVARGEAVALTDPFGGRSDLSTRLVRAVSEQTFRSDPARLLRAVRLCVELGFDLDATTASVIRRDLALLGQAAPERQRDELGRILSTDRAAAGLRLLDSLGLLEGLLPEVTAGRGVSQPKEHYWDVFDHALETVAALDFMLSETEPGDRRQARLWRELWDTLAWLPPLRDYLREELVEGRCRAALLKLAALLHDVAKPDTRAPDKDGRIRFFGHAKLGAERAEAILRRLRFSAREARLVTIMVAQHLRPGQIAYQGPPTRRALFRFFRDSGEAAPGVLLLTLADHAAARGPRMRIDGWRNHVAYLNYLLARRYTEETLVEPPRLLSGHDIMAALGIPPGPEVGRLLSALEEAQAVGEAPDRDSALALVRRLHEAGAGKAKVLAGSAAKG